MAYLTPDKVTTLTNGLVIKEYLLTAHNPNRIALPVKRPASVPLIGTTLHNTDWIDVNPATTPAEQYVRATVNGNMGDVRVHWYVDDKCAWHILGDEYEGWHAATGAGGQGNANTVSIECIMRNQTDAVSIASMNNAAKLIAWIFGLHGWTLAENNFTHNYWTNYLATGKMPADLDTQSLRKVSTTVKWFNDASKYANRSGKYCPAYILPQWEKFKAAVSGYLKAPAVPAPAPEITMYRVRQAWVDSKTQIGAYTNLDSAKSLADERKAQGYKVFDADGAVVYDPAAAIPEGDTGKELAALQEEYGRLKADFSELSAAHSSAIEERDGLRGEKVEWQQEEIELHSQISARDAIIQRVREAVK